MSTNESTSFYFFQNEEIDDDNNNNNIRVILDKKKLRINPYVKVWKIRIDD